MHESDFDPSINTQKQQKCKLDKDFKMHLLMNKYYSVGDKMHFIAFGHTPVKENFFCCCLFSWGTSVVLFDKVSVIFFFFFFELNFLTV